MAETTERFAPKDLAEVPDQDISIFYTLSAADAWCHTRPDRVGLFGMGVNGSLPQGADGQAGVGSIGMDSYQLAEAFPTEFAEPSSHTMWDGNVAGMGEFDGWLSFSNQSNQPPLNLHPKQESSV